MTQSPLPTILHDSTSEPMCNLHMLVPVAARRHAKLAAVASGIPFREYVAWLLLQAKPFCATSRRCSAENTMESVITPTSVTPVSDCARDVGRNVVSGDSNVSR